VKWKGINIYRYIGLRLVYWTAIILINQPYNTLAHAISMGASYLLSIENNGD
jgi:hypothetical protein